MFLLDFRFSLTSAVLFFDLSPDGAFYSMKNCTSYSTFEFTDGFKISGIYENGRAVSVSDSFTFFKIKPRSEIKNLLSAL